MKEIGRKRKAVLVGCNYPNTEYELKGCINDVLAMKSVLITRFGFKEEDIELLTDEHGSSALPTGVLIKKSIENMVDCASEGDVLYFHYSGHGTLIPSLNNEPQKKDEAIVPCDFNLITDMDFRQLVNRLPPKASFTILSDSCHSGGLIAQEKEQIGPFTIESKAQAQSGRPRHIPYEKILQKLKQSTSIDTLSFFIKEVDNQEQLGCLERAMKNDCGILLSGCQSNETSADVNMEADKEGKAHGAFSYAIEQVLMQNLGQLNNKEVVMKAREVLLEQGYKQHPCLYCSDENANAIFLMQP